MTRYIRYEADQGVARVTLDRPEVRNALGFTMLVGLTQAVDEALHDPAVRVLKLDAQGPAFCAGMDLKSVDLKDPEQAARFAAALSDLYLRLLTFPKTFVCAVDGPVSGGGVGLAAAADLVWAGPEARFSLPETRLGLVPALVSVVLRRRISAPALTQLALGGVAFDAAQAASHGLVDFCSVERAAVTADAFVQTLLVDHAPGALVRTKRLLMSQTTDALERQLAVAAHTFEEAVHTEEARKGLDAFRRKEFVRWNTQ